MLENTWLTLAEAAQVTGYTEGYLRRLLRNAKIPGQKFSERMWLIEKKVAENIAKTPSSTGRPRSGKKV